jgi:aminopeptidase N
MKRKALIVLLVLAVCLPSFGQTVDWSKKALRSERSRSYDALHYLIKIELDLEQKTFGGATTVTVASFREGLTTCVLDAEEFTVTSVVSDDGVALKFDQTAKELAVHLARPYKFGEELSFTCFYHGRDPKIGLRFMPETVATVKSG